MAREFYTDLNLKNNRLTNALLTVESAASTTALYPEAGRIIIDNGILKYHDGVSWKTVGSGGSGSSSSTAYPYNWSANTFATDPGRGRIKGNAMPNTTLITELYGSIYDTNGQVVLALPSLTVGSSVLVYKTGQGEAWSRYQLTSLPVAHGTPTEWLTLPVAYRESGPASFTPIEGTPVLLLGLVTGGTGAVGPPGPAGPVGPPGPEGDPALLYAQPETPTTGSIGIGAEFWLDTDAPDAVSIPSGGTVHQVLTKMSTADYDAAWATIPITVSDTAPEDPSIGDVWIDTT